MESLRKTAVSIWVGDAGEPVSRLSGRGPLSLFGRNPAPRRTRRLGGMIRELLAVPACTALSLGLAACAGADEAGATGRDPPGEGADGAAAAVSQERPAEGTDRDWEIAREAVGWALDRRLDTLPRFGDVLARIGERLVGTAYEPRTLELSGPERLVVNLEALDCVTFVENVLVMARLVRSQPREAIDDLDRFKAAYRSELTRIRYRGGVLDGYASRLHYFSEWIADNEAMGLVDAISQDLGGIKDGSAIDFMSTHPNAYRQLADPAVLAEIAGVEARLGEVDRHYIPAQAIDAAAAGIEDGDIIAATSTVEGLDVAHTGIALWRDGVLRLMHAPLAGSHVQISEESLAERVTRIAGQDGIMVARPLPPGA